MTSGDTSKGKQLFSEKCASCHTLADAKSQGTVGPNLDDAFSSDKQQGFSQQTMADIVRGQIAYADPRRPDEAEPRAGLGRRLGGALHREVRGQPDLRRHRRDERAAAEHDGSGGGTTGSAAPNGKAVFASAGCGGCHTLKAAGATGTVGPNLDALKPSEPASSAR